MTIDQRLEFLVQSTESLHATTALHTDQIARNSEQIESLTNRIERLTTKIEKLTNKIDAIASTMGELALAVLDHERRLGKLDGAQ